MGVGGGSVSRQCVSTTRSVRYSMIRPVTHYVRTALKSPRNFTMMYCLCVRRALHRRWLAFMVSTFHTTI